MRRSDEMYLLVEEMARAHQQELRDEAERARRVHRLLAARRAQRRAERAVARARLLLARV